MKEYHTSLYTIFVKLEDNSGDYLLVHGYRGAIDHVTANVAKFLRFGAPVNKEDIHQFEMSPETYDTLIERGYITDKSPLEEKQIVHKMAEIFHKGSSQRKNFLFLVAYDCNFRCPYCFENAISNNGKGWSKKVFSKEAIDKAYLAMDEVEPDRKKHNNEITLYGGEPLLKQNKEVVKYIVEQGKARGYKFKAITNGYDLDHFLDILNPENISSLQISIDGIPEKHNARRTHFEEGNSFFRIMENMAKVLEQNVTISVRINTDLTNFDDIKLLHTIFRERGFFEYKHFGVYSALVHGADQFSCNVVMTNNSVPQMEEDVLLKESSFDVIREDHYNPDSQYIDFEVEQERLSGGNKVDIQFHDDVSKEFSETDKMHLMNRGKYIDKHYKAVEVNPNLHQISCQDFGIGKTIRNVLEGKGLMPFKSVFCSAQTSMMLFDPYGDIYTCWETVGMDQHKVGSYRNGVEFYEKELEKWYGRNISKTPACSKCKYAFFCGGGCQAHALAEGRGYNSSYCDGFPKTFQTVVPREYQKFLEKQEQKNLV